MTRKNKKAVSNGDSADKTQNTATLATSSPMDVAEAKASIADDIRQSPTDDVGTDGSNQLMRPYRSIVTSDTAGIELGENFRFRQRVLKFRDKPDEQTRAKLKQNGFTFRPNEGWTVPATPESREFTDRFMRELLGSITR